MALSLRNNDGAEEARLELTEHLAELRTRIIRSIIYLIIGGIVMYACFTPMYHFLSAPIQHELDLQAARNRSGGFPGGLLFTQFTEPFFLRLQIAVVGGLIIAIPFVIGELWGFIAPGLTPTEKRAVRYVAPLSIVLFFLGVSCAYLVMPMAIHWFLSYLGDFPHAVLLQNPLTYIVFTVKMLLVFGLVFEMPVVLMFLGKVGILTSAFMWKYWRQISVGLFTFAMVVAPSNDPGTMLALAIPLTILFFGSIGLVKLVEPKPSS